jgi:hypothetical protein
LSLSITILSCNKESNKESNEEPTLDGLVSFYNFQGNANDVFGPNNGVENNVKYISFDNQNGNKFLVLDGYTSYITIPETFDYENRTISLWFNIQVSRLVMGVVFSSDSPDLVYGMVLLNTRLVDSQNNLYFNVSNHQDTVIIQPHKWYNATILTEEKKYSFYLNGDFLSTGILSDYVSSNNGNPITIIGCDRTLGNRYFEGFIDNLRIYNRKLSDKEIKVIYRAGF